MKLADYAKTERQREVVEAWERHNRNATQAASELDITPSTVRNFIHAVKAFASSQGYSEAWDATGLVPEGEIVIGRSVYSTDDLGNKTWLKTKRPWSKEDQKEALEGFVEGLAKSIPVVKPTKPKKGLKWDQNLLPTIVIGDAHFGMRADARETKGRDYDTKIAKNEMLVAIDHLVGLAPASEKALLVNVGDFVHANSSAGTTFKGTKLDVDTRIEVVLETAAQAFKFAISRMLEKHKNIIVIMARGNHDNDTAIALALILKFYYEKEKRVTIMEPHGFFHTLTFGKNLLAVHHGDKVRSQKLASIMPRMLPEQWSSTVYRKWILGHVHHQSVIETDNGVICETFSTLAPPDSWHAGAGYGAASVMHQIVFHREGGEAIRHVYQIRDDAKQPDLAI